MSEQIQARQQGCWQCGEQVLDHFCAACRRIQPLDSGLDYFSFFDLPRRFNLDLVQLEGKFYQLSRNFHPDFFFNASSSERQFSMDRSAMLNDAYRTLKDPLKRANYLLEQEGVKVAERKGKTPPDLLEEVFELNEQMDELRFAKQAQARDEVESLKPRVLEMESMLKERAAGLQSHLREIFNRWDALPNSADNSQRRALLDQVNEALAHMSYINNLINDIEEEFND